jgi:hypothetical protein
MPQQKQQPHLQPRLRRDRALNGQLREPAFRAAKQGMGDLWPAPYLIGKATVEYREARRLEDRPAEVAVEKRMARPLARQVKQITSSHDLRDHAVKDAGVADERSAEYKQARPTGGDLKPPLKLELSRIGHERHHRGRSTRHYAHARVQPGRQLWVKVEQVSRVP